MKYASAVVIAVVLLALVGWQVHKLVVNYRAATGTPWQRFLAAFSHSATILTARAGVLVSALFAFAINFLPTLDPSTQLGAALSGVLEPKYVPFYTLAYALLVEFARRSKGSVDPILPPPAS